MIRKYGLTLDAFTAMLAGQGGVCAACGSMDWGHQGPEIDHDHVTGAIRGILCHGCNVAAGYLQDSVIRAEQLAAYIKKQQ